MDKRFRGTDEEYKEFRRKRNISNKKYYSKPEVKEKKKKYRLEYKEKNKDKISEYGYRLRARPEYKERVKKWKEDNKEHLRILGIEWRKKNKDKKAFMDKEYHRKNKDRINFVHREWNKRNIEIKKGYNKKYYKTDKGIINYTKFNHKRIATIKERPFDLSKENIKKIYNRDKVCVYCGNNINLELDHITPLKLGGDSLFNNFVLSCAKCNRSKSGRNVFDWCKLQGIEVPKIVLELLESQKQRR